MFARWTMLSVPGMALQGMDPHQIAQSYAQWRCNFEKMSEQERSCLIPARERHGAVA
ncbi:hypothetical protein P368_05230 [Comamonas thiooxydans]|uniref:Uncharacterized protein n=1 Tax=Comamonas thiooxydans TaxID=363952 RepID=A0A096CBV4_9BURK|nr:hypothetical protein P245_15740 [Comamonas thiooxydans]KGG93964.1 hypothetical protein P369_06615 [Comamonas thiooxydans]KGG99929.1 hypothetical protein P367_07620 [Comamonas thiooxydans]KGH06322.1 hypothetical protein P365_06750 [Comamonas thiooxydans]KGH14726.1 hypothetical protein P368_05230 [Comamonas thiooxydans]